MVRCIIVLLLCLWAPYTESREKIDKDKCRHMTSSGLIDLNLLAHDDNTPRFKDVQDQHHMFGFSWNPCSPFNEENCQGVEVCQVVLSDRSQDYVLGRAGTSQFIEQSGALFVNYRTESSAVGVRETYIQLICNKDVDGELVFNEENPPLTYHMTLTSRYACPMSLTTPHSPTVNPTHPSPGPHIFNLKTITFLLACILVSLCILNCMVFLGLITRSGKRRNNTSTEHTNQAFEKKPLP